MAWLAILTPPALLLVAHSLRALRWALLFPAGALTRRFDLLLSLGVGYGVNLVLPAHLGDVLRAAMATERTEEARFPYVAATVAVERLTDLACVAVLLAVMNVVAGARGLGAWDPPLAMFVVAAAGAAAGRAVRVSPAARAFVWRGASIFNDAIKLAIVDFVWSFGEILFAGSVLRWRYLVASVAMWAAYLVAYAAFARYVGVSFDEIVRALHASPLSSLASQVTTGEASRRLWSAMAPFVTLPILVIVAYGGVRAGLARNRAIRRLRQVGMSGTGSPSAMRQRFKAPSAYEQYLADLFDSGAGRLHGYEKEAIGEAIVHKFFNGGSEAITALVEVSGELRVRKFASQAAATKLEAQADWLEGPARALLPLTRVVERAGRDGLFRYDMAMVTPTNDFYEVIHTAPLAHSEALMRAVTDGVSALHRDSAKGPATPATIDAYLDAKARRNAAYIEDFARRAVRWDDFSINGDRFDPELWRRLQDLDWLRTQISDPRAAVVHGDLTIENIIVAPGSAAGYYLIDPNPDNIFDTPLIDWAKLMQSLHLGYENLNLGLACRREESGLWIPSLRSQNYAQLHVALEREIVDRLGETALREVYFHELINYLRLTPYKIRQSPARGLGFFACTAILAARYHERWR